jgi:hypothetical protein
LLTDKAYFSLAKSIFIIFIPFSSLYIRQVDPNFKWIFLTFKLNPVRNSSEALNPAGIILKSNSAAAAGPEGLWPGGSSGALFLTG